MHIIAFFLRSFEWKQLDLDCFNDEKQIKRVVEMAIASYWKFTEISCKMES